MASDLPTSITELREAGLMDCAGMYCTYCRAGEPCRPMPVDGRAHIPALCDDCYVALREAGRLDYERDHEVFFP